MEIKIKTAFDLGDEVYVRTDPEQHKGILISVTKNWNGAIIYEVAFGTEAHCFQAIELTKEQDLKISVELENNKDDDE